MILKLPITQEMRIQLMHAENLIIDLSESEDIQDLKASCAGAHLHIDILHALIKSNDILTATDMVFGWEVDQCPS